uniref:Uncharacterized protein n=1 Tax=viral metagenome TaxID=1070528 RepID=A0A6C0E8V1_9ZZZZ
MKQTEFELPFKFTKGENYKGKNIISFSSAGRYFTLGTDEVNPIVISGPVKELLDILVKLTDENDHILTDKDHIQQLPSSFPLICRLIQIQFPDIFVHLVTNKYPDNTFKTKIVISGRTRYNHVINNQIISYYPSNKSIIIKDRDMSNINNNIHIPLISHSYCLNNMKKYTEDHIQHILNIEKEVLKNGTKCIPDTQPAYQTICQWINKSIKKINSSNLQPNLFTCNNNKSNKNFIRQKKYTNN